MRNCFCLLFCVFVSSAYAQNTNNMELPYHQIPDHPQDFTSGNIIARLIDGLGYRYYWATEDLTEDDLNYKPSAEGKTTFETIKHIQGLSGTILNACKNQPNIRSEEKPQEMSYEMLRENTLGNLKQASDAVKGKNAEEVSNLAVIFQRGDNKSEFPFWNMINGPIADAIYHTGQVVSFRRSSGNPINPKVNVFTGKTGS